MRSPSRRAVHQSGVRVGEPSEGTSRHLSSFTLYAAIRAPRRHHVRGLRHFLACLQHYPCCCDFMKASKHAFNNSLNFISLLAAATLNALTNSRGILNCMGTSSADGTTPRWRVALCEWGFTGVRSVPSRAWVLAMASFPFFP